MDKKKGTYNVVVSMAFKVLLLISSLLVRRLLIQKCGIGVSGLNSLYVSLIGFMSVAELGIGTAITYSLYEPIVNDDIGRIRALYSLLRKAYIIVGVIILICGIVLIPFLHCFVADYDVLGVNINLTFLIAVLTTSCTYFYSCKATLINAYKDDYISTAVTSSCHILRDVAQIITLIITCSFEVYLICALVAVVIDWVATSLICHRMHPDIGRTNNELDEDTKFEVIKNVKASFMHKIGGVLVNAADSVIISTFIGAATLGGYSNYTVILSGVVSVIALCFSPLTSVIGHMCVSNDKKRKESYFNIFYSVNFILGTVFFLGYFAIADDLIDIIFGNNLILIRPVVYVITLNQFVQFMRQAVITFRSASGTFYYDRWRPLAEGVVNIVLSVIFVKVFPSKYKVIGVIVATIITNLLICHTIEPFVLYKYEFNIKSGKYMLKNYLYITVFAIALALSTQLLITNSNPILELFINGIISIIISIVVFIIIYVLDLRFREDLIILRDNILSIARKTINKWSSINK